MGKLNIYTDGSCSGNPGPGGWGAIGLYTNDLDQQIPSFEISGHQADTTNNQMELVAVGATLQYMIGLNMNFNSDEIIFVTDSANVIGWLSQGWKRRDPKIQHLCAHIDSLLNTIHNRYPTIKIAFQKVKGHATDIINNQVDKLAVDARNEGIAKRGAK